MKPTILAILASLCLCAFAGCDDDRDCGSCSSCPKEKAAANQAAAAEAEKSFDKENPANPAAMQTPAK